MVPRTRGVVPRFARGAGGHQAVILGPSEHLPVASLATVPEGQRYSCPCPHPHPLGDPSASCQHPIAVFTGWRQVLKASLSTAASLQAGGPEDRAWGGAVPAPAAAAPGPSHVCPAGGGGSRRNAGQQGVTAPAPQPSVPTFLLPYTCLLTPGPRGAHLAPTLQSPTISLLHLGPGWIASS